jgi:hypothetical protein
VTQVRKATILVEWQQKDREPKTIPVQYNPTEYTLDKSAQIAEINIPGLEAPLQQFVRGQAAKLTLDLFFDTTEHGMAGEVVAVTSETDKIYQLIKIEPERHAPPILVFVWSDKFPGISLGGAPGSGPAATGAAGSSAVSSVAPAQGNQRDSGFCCVMESIKQKFTLFSPDGVPLRATLTVSLREYRSLEDQLKRLNLLSPDRTHAHVVQTGDTLAAISQRYYERPGAWRAIADANAITDPRRLNAGRFLQVPRTR